MITMSKSEVWRHFEMSRDDDGHIPILRSEDGRESSVRGLGAIVLPRPDQTMDDEVPTTDSCVRSHGQ